MDNTVWPGGQVVQFDDSANEDSDASESNSSSSAPRSKRDKKRVKKTKSKKDQSKDKVKKKAKDDKKGNNSRKDRACTSDNWSSRYSTWKLTPVQGSGSADMVVFPACRSHACVLMFAFDFACCNGHMSS